MASFDDRLSELLRALRERLPGRGPEWPDGNERDPGTTLLALFGQLADELLARAARLPAAGRAELARIGARLATLDRGHDPVDVRVNGERWRAVSDLAGAAADAAVYELDVEAGVIRFGDGRHGRRPENGARVDVVYREGGAAARTEVALSTVWPPEAWIRTVATRRDGRIQLAKGRTVDSTSELERLSFVEGQLLTAADFEAEQNYVRERFRRRARVALGTGVVSGLNVTVASDASATTLTIAPGVAIDGRGETIVVPRPVAREIGEDAGGAAVQLLFSERPARFVPAGSDESSADGRQPSRVVEGFAVVVSAVSDPHAVVLARLVHDHTGWHVTGDET
jgi:hypothetical protein